MLGMQASASPTMSGICGDSYDSFEYQPRQHARRKRKAETQDGEASQDRERLSKRLSQLNIEKTEPRLDVPVELKPPCTGARTSNARPSPVLHDSMQVDDSKHKVYIHDIDAELSSDSECEEGKVIFLPDIEKHFKHNRIPRHVLANDEGELAGMQLILYNDPKSLSVPEEQDGVRKAVIEARQRLRQKQKQDREGATVAMHKTNSTQSSFAAHQGHDHPALHDNDEDDAMELD